MTDFDTWVAALRGSVSGSSNGVFIDVQLRGLTFPPPAAAAVANPNANYLKTILPLNEYFTPALLARDAELGNDHWVEHLVRQHSRDDLLVVLAALNHGGDRLQDYVIESLRGLLVLDLRASLDRALSRELPRKVLCRQGILLAIKAVIRANAPGLDAPDFPPLLTGVLLAQAALNSIPAIPPSTGQELFATMDGALAHNVVQGYLFEDTDEPVAMMERTRRLWLDYPPRTPLRATPADLLLEATGLDPDTMAKLGLMLWATLQKVPPLERPLLFQWAEFPFDGPVLDAARAYLSATPDAMEAGLDPAGGGEWDFLVFEFHPIAELSGGALLVLDETLLWRRLSTSLLYPVLDFERDREKRLAPIWLTAYGEMNEGLANDLLRRLALPVGGGEVAYCDGDKIKEVFAGQKTADGFLWYGTEGVVAEIFAGGPTIDMRVRGTYEALEQDLDKQIWDKVVQLDETVVSVLNDDRSLTGFADQTVTRVRPLLVQGREFPAMPITYAYVRSGCESEERPLLQQPGVEHLAIVEVHELEMLLGLCESTDHTFPELLTEWCEGPRRGWCLKNHLLAVYGPTVQLRPQAMTDEIKRLLRELEVRARGDRGSVSG